ncbi:MAG TPA: hypothetical protein VK492_03020 [Chitinophagaceae bacterium]|nr:hypothetical protein [Chitinophagaceae bacterium]
MNKYTFSLLFSFLAWIGCSKEEQTETTPSYYLNFKLNGSLLKHSYPTYSSLKPNATIPGSYDFQLSSNSDDQKTNIGFSIHKAGAITTGSYATTDNSVQDAAYTILPTSLAIEKYYSAFTTGHTPSSFSITLTEITDKYFKGTFTGSYLYNEDRTDSIRITDGEFFLLRHN